jgi:hypothetical protein
MDNSDPGVSGNQNPTAAAEAGIVSDAGGSGSVALPAAASTPTQVAGGGWKSTLRADLKDSPLLHKFEDTPQGLEKAVESHANLEKLLGHEKVPIPKDANDVEGWSRFSKALGIPDKAEGYGLPDAVVPQDMAGMEFNKGKFAEIAHAHKLTPAQAKGLWETYTKTAVEEHGKLVASQRETMTQTVNALKGEWGDAYQQNVELGQMVINKFADSPESNDKITAALLQFPEGVKFLAKIGDQFAENKVGEFTAKRFTLAPEQAKDEWTKIIRDPAHPYNNDKATPRERQSAIDYVNSLIATVNRGR